MNQRKTKIVCTIGPASSTAKTIRELIKAGMNVARLNFSHGTHESHRETIKLVRSIAKELGTYVAILQDLCGPKIRMGILPADGVLLNVGGEISIHSGDDYKGDKSLPVSYPQIHKDVAPHERILLADGMIALEVQRIDGKDVVCKVLNGGVIYSKKGVNMPHSKLQVSAFSEKDRADLLMGLAEQVDYVAISFVRTADDMKGVQDLIATSEHKPKVIAKIEKPQAVQNIDSILAVADGIMVARGDLGVEVPLEEVPIIQKDLIGRVRESGKLVITATQMLMSMVSNPRPTRSEASDVANAILDGTDAVMLSDESANGKYPVEACATLDTIARATEPHVATRFDAKTIDATREISIALSRAACWLAADVKADAILVYTHSGRTALEVARFRPSCPVVAMTQSEYTCRFATLYWGTTPIQTSGAKSTDELFALARSVATKNGISKTGGRVVVTSGDLPAGDNYYTTTVRVLNV
ncbi:pyruvate kinase [Deferribacterales bacterium RsTz2092]|nr:pyruvate kinase [Deferribacterales bacterium]